VYKLCFYVPVTHVEAVKAAIFAAGAGRVGNYDSCAWQVLGEGQFRPLAGSNPFIGTTGKSEIVAEYKVETVCEDAVIRAVVAALRAAHPYEEPAYQVWRLESF
jgi:hypothetical protein